MTHRRGNGLLADSYVPLILLPPALADVMLDALRRAGIAAYAVPLGEDVLEPDGITLEEPPTDHLYVDTNERSAAEEILRAELPGLRESATEPGDDAIAGLDEAPTTTAQTGRRDPAAPADGEDEEVWADLVARFYAQEGAGDLGPPVWPDAENVSPGERERPPEPDEEHATDETPTVSRRGRREGVVEEDEGHYVPPPPPPLPRGDLVSRLSWGGLFGGPLLLLGSMLVGMRIPGWLAFLAVGAFIVGFVVLVARMGDRPPRDSGPDDGAVL
ncbi:hypothetical protein ACQEU5_01200 [Marinactinospora thermotolerans]|uniref:Uncharacterized protein n=1 Tax=Marinactinospora thermotolerans DSM 45154 TaxID=1122192 RepID=A0A1T4MF88_9ACTN|nr:hypothetical protein [Marinactinospora thermotolerans]SJZ65535.1 hypothetical protein SAMN02745673_01087 [Marinactinospora thermotolerans DSM 45154]